MSLILAPYNDSMRLGQGFNSYHHELCIDGAVSIKKTEYAAQKQQSTAQVVSYSARFVEKLSDVIEGMNISPSASIRKGTVEVSGSTSTIDETTFKSADLNVVIAVKVTNQRTTISETAEFQPIDGINPGTELFDRVYGDSYISGFIDGGEFTGIVSIKVIDKNKRTKVLNEIRSKLDAAKDNELELSTAPGSRESELSNALRSVESTISVSWMGGGQVKTEGVAWDLESVLAAASDFPARVAECPRKTWAILTRYRANQSFIRQTQSAMVKTLEYDLVGNYTAELFDAYMDYKILLKTLQHIISNRNDYERRPGVANALDTSMNTLLSVRAAFRQEQSKLVEAVGVLGRDPAILKRQANRDNLQRAPIVTDIILKALGPQSITKQFTQQFAVTTVSQAGPTLIASDLPASQSNAVSDEAQISDGESDKDFTSIPKPDKLISFAETLSQNPAPKQESAPPQAVPVAQAVPPSTPPRPILDFDFGSLIPPEVFEDVMPVLKPGAAAKGRDGVLLSQTLLDNGLGLLPPPPQDGQPQLDQSEPTISKGYSQLQADLNTAEASKIDALAKRDEALRDLSIQSSKAESAASKLASMTEELERLRGELQTAQVNLDTQTKEAARAKGEAEAAKRQLEATELRCTGLQTSLSQEKAQSESNKTQAQNMRMNLDAKINSIQTLSTELDILKKQKESADQFAGIWKKNPQYHIVGVLYDDWWQTGNTNPSLIDKIYDTLREGISLVMSNEVMGGDPKPGKAKTGGVLFFTQRGGKSNLAIQLFPENWTLKLGQVPVGAWYKELI